MAPREISRPETNINNPDLPSLPLKEAKQNALDIAECLSDEDVVRTMTKIGIDNHWGRLRVYLGPQEKKFHDATLIAALTKKHKAIKEDETRWSNVTGVYEETREEVFSALKTLQTPPKRPSESS